MYSKDIKIKQLEEKLKIKDDMIKLLKERIELSEKSLKVVEDMYVLVTGVPLYKDKLLKIIP